MRRGRKQDRSSRSGMWKQAYTDVTSSCLLLSCVFLCCLYKCFIARIVNNFHGSAAGFLILCAAIEPFCLFRLKSSSHHVGRIGCGRCIAKSIPAARIGSHLYASRIDERGDSTCRSERRLRPCLEAPSRSWHASPTSCSRRRHSSNRGGREHTTSSTSAYGRLQLDRR